MNSSSDSINLLPKALAVAALFEVSESGLAQSPTLSARSRANYSQSFSATYVFPSLSLSRRNKDGSAYGTRGGVSQVSGQDLNRWRRNARWRHTRTGRRYLSGKSSRAACCGYSRQQYQRRSSFLRESFVLQFVKTLLSIPETLACSPPEPFATPLP